jgi:hypothetical protein
MVKATPGSLRDLRSGYAEMAEPVLRARNEAVNLERKLSDLVNGAYGLTDEESDLLFARPLRPRTPHHSLLPQASSHAIR